jgi:anti-sigma28 factor (negative regulator of flagellin synthesis)
MKVTNNDLASLGAAGAAQTQQTQKSSSGGANASSKGRGSDSVDFSSALGSLSRAMTSFSSNRGATVQALTSQYQSGAYSANSSAVSSGLISEALGQ